ncbi:hypothetical protein FORC066_0651 [Yersinia enterocolitica]|nr:hypothetical protein FORC066_0651 [Yersinia enterocolitica]
MVLKLQSSKQVCLIEQSIVKSDRLFSGLSGLRTDPHNEIFIEPLY